MSRDDTTREVTCTLTAEEVPERTAAVRSLLVAHYTGYEETAEGLDLRFDGTGDSLRAVAQFISDELLCCSFAEYEIAVSPPYEETVLTVTGPAGTREMFREGLIERLEAEST